MSQVWKSYQKTRLLTWSRGRVGRLPFCIGCLWQGIGAVFRGLVLTFSRWCRPSHICGGFNIDFLFFVYVGGFAFMVLVSRLLLCILSRSGVVIVFRYSFASYIERYFKLTTFYTISENVEKVRNRSRMFSAFGKRYAFTNWGTRPGWPVP